MRHIGGWFISNNKKRSPPRISRSPRSNFQVYMAWKCLSCEVLEKSAELLKAQEVEEIYSEVGGFSIAAWLGFGKPSSWRLPIFDHPTVEPGCFSGAAAYKCSAHRHSVKDETKRINWGNKCKNDKHSKLIEVLQLAQLVSYKNSMWFSVISIKRWVDPSDCQSAQAENDLKL